jgi:hypothetical protein
MRALFFAVIVASCGGGFVFACSASSDNTVYGPPDAGKPDANYCVVDMDCPPTANGDQACGFPIADACQARGVCVDVKPGAGKCTAPNYCGCNGDLVNTCPIAAAGYVRGGPTNGQAPTAFPDGGTGCTIGSN